MLPPAQKRATEATEMTQLLTNIGATLAWIWMTPDGARQLLRQRDFILEIREAQSKLAKAA
jgi:hypothetical protein